MELLIKISDEDYKFIKDLQSIIIGGRGNCRTIQQNVINAIRNGTPYNLSGDLISREALKKAIKDNGYSHYFEIFDIIDNAPPVKFSLLPADESKEEAYMRGYEHGKIEGIIKGMAYRPKGEWLFKHNSSDIWCSVCDENFDEIPQAFNFCPNCGADMRGGKENETDN